MNILAATRNCTTRTIRGYASVDNIAREQYNEHIMVHLFEFQVHLFEFQVLFFERKRIACTVLRTFV